MSPPFDRGMTVEDLIQKLWDLPRDYEVEVYDVDYGWDTPSLDVNHEHKRIRVR